MFNTSNLRPLIIEVEGIRSTADAHRWLSEQSETIAAVTAISKRGEIIQSPYIEDGAFVDPTAQLIGGVIVKKGCYVGPFAVIRLDEKEAIEPLVVGGDSNIQDCAIVHSTMARIGERVIIAHQAIVHGAEIRDDVTIYIQAVVDGGGTIIEPGCFLHQGSYVGKGIRVPEGRYILPGQKLISQVEADALPQVPKQLVDLRRHVLEHNRTHVERHTKACCC